jgi:hypothetical protein
MGDQAACLGDASKSSQRKKHSYTKRTTKRTKKETFYFHFETIKKQYKILETL